MSSSRVTIIVNVRNGAKTLRDCLDSALAQTFSAWELIFLDDGSTDGSAEILFSYSDSRLHYFLSNEHKSLASARQFAIDKAQSEWLAFLDQDDVWLPHKLEAQMAIADSDPEAGMVYGRTILRTLHGPSRDFDHRHEFNLLPEGNIFQRLFIDSCFISMSSAILRRSLILKAGPIPSDINAAPDYYLFLVVARSSRVRAEQGVVCQYRWHQENMSHTYVEQMHQDALWCVERWADEIPIPLARSRRQIHNTILALARIRQRGSRLNALIHLIRHGSLSYLFARPFARAYRFARRKLHKPYFLRDNTHIQRTEPSCNTDRAFQKVEPTVASSHCDSENQNILSIIIVSWNVKDLLQDCLQSVFKEMRRRQRTWDVIVWDNDSADGTADMVAMRFPFVRLEAGKENLGFGKANNRALSLSRGKYVLLLNPDTLVVEHAIDQMLAIMDSRPEVGVLGCRLENADGTHQRWTGGSPPNLFNVTCHFLMLHRFLPACLLPSPIYLEQEPADDREVGWVSGACMIVRRSALKDRLFDERFFLYGEDMDLCCRLAAEGWKVLYTPRLHVIHFEGQSFKSQVHDVQMNRIHGLREVYAKRHGRRSLVLYDIVATIGFFIRTVGFSAASCVRPRDRRSARLRFQYFAESLRSLIEELYPFRRRTNEAVLNPSSAATRRLPKP